MKSFKIIYSLSFLLILSGCDCFLGFMGPDCDDDPIKNDTSFYNIIIENTEVFSEKNKVKVRFKITDDLDIGVANKVDSDFNLFEQVVNENEQLIDPLEAPRLIVPSPDSYGYATTIVMDLSGSVIDEIDEIKAASIDYVNNLFNNINSGNLEVGVYFFDGRTELQEVIDFSSSKNDIVNAINSMTRELQIKIETSLYHGVIQSCNKIIVKKEEYESNPDIKIFSSSIVVFSDGNNSNFQNVTRQDMINRIAQTSNGTFFFCIAAGGNVDTDVVNDIGVNGVFQIDNYSQLNSGLNEVLDLIVREANSNYELEICSAKRGIQVDYRLELKGTQTFGGIGSYNTQNFNSQNDCVIGD